MSTATKISLVPVPLKPVSLHPLSFEDAIEVGRMRSVTVDKLTAHLRKTAKKRWEGKSDAEKKATASHAIKAYWDAMTPEERAIEMKRRAEVRRLNKTKGKRIKRK